ncbi:hypothetical protein JHK85_052678 [Glycine max]|nr:hypothetical protein JHK85_052678 [Glycine max]
MKNTTACLKIFSTLILLASLFYIIIAPSFYTSPRIHQNLHLQSQHHFDFCPSNYTNHCPCQDPIRQRRFPKAKMFRKERHCPQSTTERLRCLIPIPPGYQTPFPWPKSKDTAWFSNVPFPKLVEYKKSQNWVRLEGDHFVFPGGGTSFPEGVKAYVNALKRLLPVPLESGDVRTVLDVGCGVASFGASLMDYGILTMSLAPSDEHQSQVQFALERGLPAILGVLSIHRLTFPSRSFDMVHCSRCLVPWTDYGITLIFSFFCCMQKLKTRRSPKFCNSSESDPDAGWYTKMTACIFPLPDVKDVHEVSGGVLEKWPMRLETVPPMVRNENDDGFTLKTYIEDNQAWKRRVSNYGVLLKSLSSGKYRNVMDMNAGFGGFAAAIVKYPVWVMNVVPFDAKSNNLGIIYERGLIGTYMDWCEPFSTYPRTYDLIHASGVFSMYMDKCDITDILLEMHRILRPKGAVIIRDHGDVILKVKEITDRIRWKGIVVAGDQDGPFHPEMIMVINNDD